MLDNYADISSRLYHDYFDNDVTPPELVSSHWVKMHADTAAGGKQGGSRVGQGFGYFPGMSLSNKALAWCSICAHLAILPNTSKIFPLLLPAVRLSQRIGHPFTFDLFRQVCTYALLRPHVRGKRFLIIGDGIGFLSAFIREMAPQARVTLVDLGKTLFFQVGTIRMAHAEAKPLLVDREGEWIGGAAGDGDFIFCPAESVRYLEDQEYDVAVNINSMQEMNEGAIAIYFDFLRKTLAEGGLFYCSNREEKTMPSGEISRFAEYPWEGGDMHLVDEGCPWSRFFLDRSTLASGPKLLGIRVPFVNYYDGGIRHRLSRLAKGTRQK